MNRLLIALPSMWAPPLVFILFFALPAAAQQVDDRATLWFYREAADSDQNPTIFKTVTSFAERLAILEAGRYFALDVPAGLHRFSWTAGPSRNQIITIEAQAGENVFVHVRFRSMAVVGSDKASGILRGLRPLALHSVFEDSVSLRIFPARAPALQPQPAAARPAATPVPVTPRSQYNAILRINLDSPGAVTVPQEHTPAPPQPGDSTAESPVPPDVGPAAPPASVTATNPKAEVLTNADIVSLVEGNLPEELIAAKIRTSATKFDTAPAALIELKRARVPQSLLMLMVEISSGSAAAPN